MAVSVMIHIPGAFLCSRAQLGRVAQRDGILRERRALIRGLILCRTSSRFRLRELARVATAAGWIYCHEDSDRRRSLRTLVGPTSAALRDGYEAVMRSRIS
jgi:hypothetical protein